MDAHPPDPTESHRHASDSSKSTERAVILVVIGLVLLYALWTLHTTGPPYTPPATTESAQAIVLFPEMVPLTTGDEPIADIFTRAGCPVCHAIPGIPGANGRIGPALALGTTGTQRLSDPTYGGKATTVHDYIVESVLEPERFVVPGYPSRTMPIWYGSKLSALALEKIAAYLEKQTDVDLGR